MPTNSTTPELLSDEALTRIEARAKAASVVTDETEKVRYDHGGGRMYSADADLILDVYNAGDREFYFNARTDIPALCQTVRALEAALRKANEVVEEGIRANAALRDQLAQAQTDAKARNILLLKLGGRGDLLAKEHVNPDSLDGLDAATNEFDRLRNCLIPELKSRLAQVEKDRDKLRADLELGEEL